MKKIKLTVLLLLVALAAIGQTLSPQVTATGGGYATGGGNSLSWTAGETNTATLQAGSNELSQGFQQSEVNLFLRVSHQPDSKSNDELVSFETSGKGTYTARLDEGLKITVYPNPSNGQVFVKINGHDKTGGVTFYLVDISGKVLYQNQTSWVQDEERLFDFSSLPKGIYNIRCQSETENLIQKIVIQ